MSDYSQGAGWWQASDGKWYSPESASGAAPVVAPAPFTAPTYGQPQYGQYGQYGAQPLVEPKKSNGLAIAAMVCGIVGLAGGLFTCGILAPAGIVAVVLGHIALRQIKADPTQGSSRGMALAGVITGWITVVIGIILVIVLIVLAATDDDFNNAPVDDSPSFTFND